MTVALLALAVLKPWGGPPTPPLHETALVGVHSSPVPPPIDRRSTGFGGADASPLAPPASLRPDQIDCSFADWQLVSLDRLAAWTARTWLPAAPVQVPRPDDPSIPAIALDSPAVLALGACAPGAQGATGSAASGGARVIGAWQRHAGVLVRFPVAPIEAPDSGVPDPTLAELYRPAATPARTPWPAGRYVIALEPIGPAGPGVVAAGPWYLALDVPPPRAG